MLNQISYKVEQIGATNERPHKSCSKYLIQLRFSQLLQFIWLPGRAKTQKNRSIKQDWRGKIKKRGEMDKKALAHNSRSKSLIQ